MSTTKHTNSERRLAAILFADVVGYTALMQKDEAAATSQLRAFQSSMNEQVNSHNGKIVNFYGDGALCIFPNPLAAMRCAIDLQSGFQKGSVPVRIGIHSGTVVQEGDKVFGNNVNVASRIESMGIPGAILVSKKVRDELKNQPDLLMPSLGHFEFKNVEEPMEVFALANEGFVVPKKEEMKGKFKEKSSFSLQKILLLILAIAIIAIGFWQWQSGEGGGMSLSETGDMEPINTPLAKEIRDKRVAIMVFDNKTGSDDLDDFGVMISDWITKGLMETGDANVISAANIQDKVALAGMGGSNTQKFARETGVGVILQGRYYMQENQLIIHANVVDAEKSEVIHALKPIQGPRNEMLSMLDELTDEVLGYWSVKSKKRYLQNPPKYEAYQKYNRASLLFGDRSHHDQIETLLTEAVEIDPGFHEARLKLVVFNGNRGGNLVKRDSLISILENSDIQLSTWEQLRFDQIKASANQEWVKGAELCEKMYAMDASDGSSNYNAGNFYVRANMPAKAIHILSQMDMKYRYLDDEFSWVEPRTADAYYMLGEYQKSIEVAKGYPFPKMIDGLAYNHLRSLIRLDSISQIDDITSYYMNRGIYAGNGVKQGNDDLILSVCNDAFLLDKGELLEKYVAKLKEWNASNKNSNPYAENQGLVAFFENDINKALDHFEKAKIDPNRPWKYIRIHSLIGICHGILGQSEEAMKNVKAIEDIEVINQSKKVPHWVLSFRTEYLKARIYAAMGETEKAVSSLISAKNKGAWFYPDLWKGDIYLKSLHGQPEFEELVKPKG